MFDTDYYSLINISDDRTIKLFDFNLGTVTRSFSTGHRVLCVAFCWPWAFSCHGSQPMDGQGPGVKMWNVENAGEVPARVFDFCDVLDMCVDKNHFSVILHERK